MNPYWHALRRGILLGFYGDGYELLGPASRWQLAAIAAFRIVPASIFITIIRGIHESFWSGIFSGLVLVWWDQVACVRFWHDDD